MLRQLPSITPPPDFRAAVFAAIRADQERISPRVARAAREATNPSLPVVRPVPIASRRRLAINPRAGLAVAAVALLTFTAAKALPASGLASLGRTATSLAPLRVTSPISHHVIAYSLDPHYSIASSALATGTWLVYSATDASRGNMLFAERRKSRQATPLLSAPSLAPIAVRALSDRWAIWVSGPGDSSAPWTLRASDLSASGAPAASQLTLVDSASRTDPMPATLGGVSTNGDMVLVAGATAGGYGVLLRYDLSSGTPVVTTLVHTPAPGHLLTDPSSDGATTYWADVWYDGGLHGTIWRLDPGGQPQQVSSDDGAFHPAASGHMLVWVDVPPSTLSSVAPDDNAAQPDADEEVVNELNGGLQARDLDSGRQWQISPRADVNSVQQGGSLLLWRSDSQTHLYDLQAHAPADVDPQLRSATLASATGSTVVWEPAASAPLSVYDQP